MYIGIDVSKDSITVCLLSGYPTGGLLSFLRSTDNKTNRVFYKFAANETGKNKKANLPGVINFIQFCQDNDVKLAALEPTGVHYSKIWAYSLACAGVQVLWVGHAQGKFYRLGKGIKNKSDKIDSLILSAFICDPEHLLPDGNPNPYYYLKHRPYPIDDLRETMGYLQHNNKTQNVVGNYLQQLLSWQWPEKKLASSKTRSSDRLPPLVGYLSGSHDRIWPPSLKRIAGEYDDSVARLLEIEVDEYSREQAKLLEFLQDSDSRLEAIVAKLMTHDCFEPYHEVFDKFRFGSKTRAVILCRIYPFESFLGPDGKPIIRIEYREVNTYDKSFEKGRIKATVTGSKEKRTKTDASRNAFKLQMGMGSRLEESGDKTWTENRSGSDLAAKTLWLYIMSKIEPTNAIKDHTEVTEYLTKACDKLKYDENKKRRQDLKGNQVRMRLMSKTVNLLYRELRDGFCR